MLLLLVLFVFNFINTNICMDIPDALIQEYCKITCPVQGKKEPHTVCAFKCKLAPECVDFAYAPMTDKDRQYVLDLHNHYRDRVASGKDTRGGNGKAKDMSALNYDKDMEIPVLCWSKRCKFGHDKCRQSLKHATAGQNLYLASSSAQMKASLGHINGSAKSWYGEIVDTTKGQIQKYKSAGKMIGHFTQMVWARTKMIGCVQVSFTDPRCAIKHKVHVLCNYSPAGNMLGAPVYEFGSGCGGSQKPTKGYKALCGDLKILSSDRIPIHDSHAERIILDWLTFICLFMLHTSVLTGSSVNDMF